MSRASRLSSRIDIGLAVEGMGHSASLARRLSNHHPAKEAATKLNDPGSGVACGTDVELYFTTGMGGLSFQRLPVVWYNDPLRLTTGLMPLTGGRLARRFS